MKVIEIKNELKSILINLEKLYGKIESSVDNENDKPLLFFMPQSKVKVENKIENAPAEEEEQMKYHGITIHKNTRCKTWYTRIRKDGKQNYLSGKTQEEIKYKIDELINYTKKPKTYGLTFSQWYDKWLKTYKIGKVKPSTIATYDVTLKNINNTFKEKDIKKITPLDIENLLNSIKLDRTRQKCFELLRDVFTKAHINKVIKDNPIIAVEKPKHTRKRGSIINAQDISKYVQAFKTHKYGDIYLVILYQGLRLGECMGITKKDIDLINNTINIDKSINIYNETDTTKNKYSIRKMPLFNSAKEILKKYQDINDNDRLFSMSPNTIERNFLEILRKHNLPKIRIHDLRHTFITQCKNENIPEHVIQQWVGHQIGSKVTSMVYTHEDKDINLLYFNKLNNTKFYSHSTQD